MMKDLIEESERELASMEWSRKYADEIKEDKTMVDIQRKAPVSVREELQDLGVHLQPNEISQESLGERS